MNLRLPHRFADHAVGILVIIGLIALTVSQV